MNFFHAYFSGVANCSLPSDLEGLMQKPIVYLPNHADTTEDLRDPNGTRLGCLCSCSFNQ